MYIIAVSTIAGWIYSYEGTALENRRIDASGDHQ